MRPALVVALLAVAVAAVYLPSLGGDFVWDDRHLIESAPLVTEPSSLGAFFRAPFWSDAEQGIEAYYRPLVTISYALDHRLHGPNPAGFHLTNLLLHLVNVLLVLALARRTGAGLLGAGIAAGLWALLPRLAESVAWISGRTDLLAALFSLAALLAHPLRRAGPWLSAALLFAGLCAKEVALAALPALLLAALAAPRPERRSELGRLIPPATAAALYLTLRARVLSGAGPGSSVGAAGDRLLVSLEALGRYAAMTVDAWRPATQIGWVEDPSVAYAALGLVVAIAAAGAALRLRSTLATSPTRAACLTLAAASLVPVLHLVPLPMGVVSADRFLYLPLAGVAVSAATGLDRVARRSRFASGAFALVAVTLAVQTYRRAEHWADEVALWTEAARRAHPRNPRPWLELGNLHYRAALYEQALAFYEQPRHASGDRTGGAQALLQANRGSTLSLLGRHAEAGAVLEHALAGSPQTPKLWADLARVRLHALDFEGARAAARTALGLMPGYDAAEAVLERIAEAEVEARHLPPAEATGAAAHRRRARFHSRVGRRQDALRAWAALLEQPDATLEDADAALDYCGRFAPIAVAAHVLERRRALGGDPDPGVLAALGWRFERAAALESGAGALLAGR